MLKNTKTIMILVAILVSLLAIAYFDIKYSDQQIEKEQAPQAQTNISGDLTQEGVHVFDISGRNFEFSQKEMRVKKGDKVKVVFKSTKGYHDWVLDEFNARTEQVEPGKVTSTEFVANKAGSFEYYCSVGEHRKFGMVGKLIVED